MLLLRRHGRLTKRIMEEAPGYPQGKFVALPLLETKPIPVGTGTMTMIERVRRLGQRTWFGTIHAYIDAARRDLSYEGRRVLYHDLRALLARYEAEEARHEPGRKASVRRTEGTR